MAVAKAVRDRLLAEAGHRCTICAEKCFEIHHIVERSEDGADDPENLIVLCPNCHQHRYHRSGEFTSDQLRLYKAKLTERNEIERRLLLNLEAIRQGLGSISPEAAERQLREELEEAARLVSPERSAAIATGVTETARWLAERELLRGGARRAIEVEWEVRRHEEKAKYPRISILGVDDDAWQKAPDFPAAYRLEFVLNQRPPARWIEAFNASYRSAFNMHKRRTRIEGARIVMIVGDQDNLQGHATFAKQLMEETNRLIEQRLFARIDLEIEQGKQGALHEFDTIRSLKERTRGIKL